MALGVKRRDWTGLPNTNPQIDINSSALLNMISEEAMVQVDQPLLSACAETVASNHKVTIDEAFDNWWMISNIF